LTTWHLYFECRNNKNALLKTCFLAILPTWKKVESKGTLDD